MWLSVNDIFLVVQSCHPQGPRIPELICRWCCSTPIMPLTPSLLIFWSICPAKGMTEKIVVLKDLTAGETNTVLMRNFHSRTRLVTRTPGKAGVGMTVPPAGGASGMNAQRGEAQSESWRMSGNLPDGHNGGGCFGCDSASVQRHKGAWKVRAQSVLTSKICVGDGCIVMKLEGQAAEKVYTF